MAVPPRGSAERRSSSAASAGLGDPVRRCDRHFAAVESSLPAKGTLYPSGDLYASDVLISVCGHKSQATNGRRLTAAREVIMIRCKNTLATLGIATLGVASLLLIPTASAASAGTHPATLQSSEAPTEPGSAAAAVSICPDASSSLFGPNVCVFNPSMSQAAIQADVDRIATLQVPIGSQFSTNRYAIFFEPGTYGSAANPLVFQVGYYTQVAGLGFMPQDTVVNGMIEVFANECATRTRNGSTSYWCNSTTNFWRSLSNLQLNVTSQSWAVEPVFTPPVPGPGGPWCSNSEEAWSVSQAAPLRRLLVNGNIVFQDYCSGANDDASGGFIADSQINGALNFYGQQQYYTRDSSIGGANGCPNGLWNMVYSGVVGAPAPVFSGTCQQNTVVERTPVSEEQPFLYKDSTGWHVFVPAVRHNSVGTSWAAGPPPAPRYR